MLLLRLAHSGVRTGVAWAVGTGLVLQVVAVDVGTGLVLHVVAWAVGTGLVLQVVAGDVCSWEWGK